MDGSLSVDTGALRRSGRRIGSLADELAGARHAPDPGGQPWGDDSPGRRFAAGYVCGAEGLEGRAASLVAELREVAARLVEMADGYDDADAASTVP